MMGFIIYMLCINMKCETCQKELTGKQQKFCCRKCNNQSVNTKHKDYTRQQQRGIKRKLFFVNQLGRRCCICGYQKNLASLIFHHKDPKQKTLTLDIRSMSNNSLEVLQNEVNKCQLMCHNCHSELHHPEMEIGGPSPHSSGEPIVYETIALTKG